MSPLFVAAVAALLLLLVAASVYYAASPRVEGALKRYDYLDDRWAQVKYAKSDGTPGDLHSMRSEEVGVFPIAEALAACQADPDCTGIMANESLSISGRTGGIDVKFLDGNVGRLVVPARGMAFRAVGGLKVPRRADTMALPAGVVVWRR